MPALAKRRVIAPDMVGFGFTDRPAGIHYNMDGLGAQALDLLDALGIEQVDLVGNSFGGALALALAIRAPQRVRRLVLMGRSACPSRSRRGSTRSGATSRRSITCAALDYLCLGPRPGQ
jgi:2-hydroxymuconate-semialdehyde hydrolase